MPIASVRGSCDPEFAVRQLIDRIADSRRMFGTVEVDPKLHYVPPIPTWQSRVWRRLAVVAGEVGASQRLAERGVLSSRSVIPDSRLGQLY